MKKLGNQHQKKKTYDNRQMSTEQIVKEAT